MRELAALEAHATVLAHSWLVAEIFVKETEEAARVRHGAVAGDSGDSFGTVVGSSFAPAGEDRSRPLDETEAVIAAHRLDTARAPFEVLVEDSHTVAGWGVYRRGVGHVDFASDKDKGCIGSSL